jgi:hypothetical protein
MSPLDRDTPDDGQPVDVEDRWRPRPRRLLIGVALIVLAIALSVFNGTIGGEKAPPRSVVHGAVATRVQVLGGVRVRPELPAGSVAPPSRVTISFHNDGTRPRAIAPTDLTLVVGRQRLHPLAGGRGELGAVTLQPGAFVTRAVSFAQPLAPGATLVFAPPWSQGRRLQWLLWQ